MKFIHFKCAFLLFFVCCMSLHAAQRRVGPIWHLPTTTEGRRADHLLSKYGRDDIFNPKIHQKFQDLVAHVLQATPAVQQDVAFTVQAYNNIPRSKAVRFIDNAILIFPVVMSVLLAAPAAATCSAVSGSSGISPCISTSLTGVVMLAVTFTVAAFMKRRKRVLKFLEG